MITLQNAYPFAGDVTLDLRIWRNQYGGVTVSAGHPESAHNIELSRAEARRIAIALLSAAEGETDL